MALFLLIRHGMTDTVGISLAGRMPGIHLNEQGRRQAESLAAGLAGAPLAALVASPLERARETAGPIGQCLDLKVRVSELINELDFGEWTGCTIASLEGNARWRDFNLSRSCTPIPGGETMVDVQKRVVAQFEELGAEFGEGAIALVTHGDVIRAAVAYYAGIALDLLTRITVDVASTTLISIRDRVPRILFVNHGGDSVQLLHGIPGQRGPAR